MFGDESLDEIFLVVEPLLADSDKYKQRAGAEILSGVLRGEQFVFSRVS
jgi:proteasome activator subunit 4